MKKIMISQPMANLKDEEIMNVRDRAFKNVEKLGFSPINTFFNNDSPDETVLFRGVWFLAKSIDALSKVDAIYFCKGWKNARGCKIEHDIATAYGLSVFYEQND